MFLSDTHLQVKETARAFANDVIRPIAEKLDREESFPAEIYQKMVELGLLGIGVPESLGGPGLDTVAYAVVMEELSRGYSSVADQCGLVELIGTLLTKHGTPDQQKLLVDILAMKKKVEQAPEICTVA
jgi:hypothetical protein